MVFFFFANKTTSWQTDRVQACVDRSKAWRNTMKIHLYFQKDSVVRTQNPFHSAPTIQYYFERKKKCRDGPGMISFDQDVTMFADDKS
jgi:hypothetical protein